MGKKGYWKGKKLSKAHKRKIGENSRGERSGRWKGGRIYTDNGYVRVLSHSHPYGNIDKYVLEHRLVMEAHIGRVLLPLEVVHHINGIKDDNRIENLMLFADGREHTMHHLKGDSDE